MCAIVPVQAPSEPNRNSSVNNCQIELHISSGLKNILQTAADLSGQDLASFIIGSAEDKASVVIDRFNRIELEAKHHHALLDALMSPAKPTPGLRELMAETPLRRR